MYRAHLDVGRLLLMERKHFGKPQQLVEQQLHIWADKINNLSADIATIQSVVSVGGISTNGYVHAQSGVFGAMTVNGGTLKQVSGVLINGTRYNLWTW